MRMTGTLSLAWRGFSHQSIEKDLEGRREKICWAVDGPGLQEEAYGGVSFWMTVVEAQSMIEKTKSQRVGMLSG